jgi:hypothetical protein
MVGFRGGAGAPPHGGRRRLMWAATLATGAANTWSAPVAVGFDTRQLYVSGQSVPSGWTGPRRLPDRRAT